MTAEEIARLPERTGDWQPHWIDIADPGVDEVIDPANPFTTIPLNEYPRALRIAINHEPPAFADGYAVLDDAALISWHEPTTLDGRYLTPSPFDFIRLQGTEATPITLEFDSWTPTAATN